jgi:hypothetical protein
VRPRRMRSDNSRESDGSIRDKPQRMARKLHTMALDKRLGRL